MGLTYAEGVYYTRAPDGTVLAARNGNVSFFYITEPNGHVAYLTDVNGATIGGYDYSPYGKATIIGNVDANPIRYLGQFQETNTSGGDQVYKFGARYYTTSGAFTQPDAVSGNLEDPRTMTAYNYATGDPVNRHDVSGYVACDSGTGYWIPPGCYGPEGSEQNVGPWATSRPGSLSDCQSAVAGTALGAGGIIASGVGAFFSGGLSISGTILSIGSLGFGIDGIRRSC